ncbi:TIGR03936 family radical SAM-associated protein [Thermotoga sp. SG1]|uniref:TIGR03936 family radical SAM-associated protein n=1 Tax=Thermotoga sp. SG1 TaxID=126739 RepID=UPI000C758B2E|nr:TIGR03936 family radical SAM-associated protein [Thermotoga sp. SG1]PLV56606.1 hypothetical protein AS006_03075 [Thermotoga sp. SG1]
MKVVLRFKKRGMKRFLSTLESIKLVERSLRRADLPLVFTEGFHPKPKMSLLDAMPVGVVNLAFYVEVHLKDLSKKHLKDLENTLPEDFSLSGAWICEENINKLVKFYRFKLITPYFIDLQNKKVEKKGKEILFKESVVDFETFRAKDYYIFRYTQRREKLLNPLLLVEKDSFFVAICEETLTKDGEDLSSFLERRGTCVKEGSPG